MWSFNYFIGHRPKGLTIDHLCKNVWCVNPFHIEVVTMSENIKRQRGSRCKNNHEFDYEKIRKDGTVRQRVCSRCHGSVQPSWRAMDPGAARL